MGDATMRIPVSVEQIPQRPTKNADDDKPIGLGIGFTRNFKNSQMTVFFIRFSRSIWRVDAPVLSHKSHASISRDPS